MGTRHQLFISYAHEDAAWRDDFTRMLEPAVRRGSIRLWSDQQIPAGADWSKDIDLALSSASVGLLLVTPSFFGSEYINDVELTRLLNLARTAGVAIHWVPISPTLYTQTPLAGIQASWDPERPLDQLPLPEQRAAVQQICLQMVEDFGFLPKVTGNRRARLPELVQARLADRYEMGEEIGTGRFSIVYRAQQRNPSRTVGVKVFVASEFDDWARQAIIQTAERGAALEGRAFIKILEYSLDETPEFLVTEFIEGEPMSRYMLHHPGGAPLTTIRNILLDLTEALEEIHARGETRGEICPSNVLIEPDGTARLAAIDYATVLGEESQMPGNFMVDRESLAYMTPEHFLGRPGTPLTDQYSLGLLAMELLGGERLPRVFSPSDLEHKRRLFADLEAGAGKWARRSPELAGFVSRLLRIDPAERWPSMQAAHQLLRDIDVAESEAEINRRIAKAAYLRLQVGDAQRVLFTGFYRNLLAACPDVERHFASVDIERHGKILNTAIQLLLDFDPARGSQKLRELAERHAVFGLNRRHYELFVEALLLTMQQSGVQDVKQLTAWRETLTPAIEFICACQRMPSSATGPAMIAQLASV